MSSSKFNDKRKNIITRIKNIRIYKNNYDKSN